MVHVVESEKKARMMAFQRSAGVCVLCLTPWAHLEDLANQVYLHQVAVQILEGIRTVVRIELQRGGEGTTLDEGTFIPREEAKCLAFILYTGKFQDVCDEVSCVGNLRHILDGW